MLKEDKSYFWKDEVIYRRKKTEYEEFLKTIA